MPQPAHYGAEAQPTQTVPAQGITQQFVVGAKPVPEWWKLYQSEALNALVDEGLRNSPTLAATDKSLAAAREQLRAQIGSSMLPTIDAGGQATRNRALAIPEAGPNTFLYNIFVGQLQAHYTFDLFGAARLADAALAARVNVQAYQFDAARRALAANIVTAAITSAALHAQIDTTERLVTIANDQARDTQRRYALGRRLARRSVERATKCGEPVREFAGFEAAMADDASCAGGAAWPHAGRGPGRPRSCATACA